MTDRCNYNCSYCNPNAYGFNGSKIELLSFEEILRLVELFAGKLEFKKFRFTGGEPLFRKGIFEFFVELAKLKRKYNFTTGLTTNGSLLKGNADRLKSASIDHLNISLDSLIPQRFYEITGRRELERILEVIEESIDAGFEPLKINVVVIKGINDNEILNFVDYFKYKPVNLRFIEFMPFGGNEWEKKGFINYREILSIVEEKYKLIQIETDKNAVAKDYRMFLYPAKISFISSISEHFCSSCNRLRISSKGKLRLCLFSEGAQSVHFKEMFKDNYSDEEIIEQMKKAIEFKWEKHPDAEELRDLAENNMMTIGG